MAQQLLCGCQVGQVIQRVVTQVTCRQFMSRVVNPAEDSAYESPASPHTLRVERHGPSQMGDLH